MIIHTNPAAGLIEDELEFRGIKSAKAAKDMGIPRSRLSDIFAGRKGVSIDTALRLQHYLGMSAKLLIRLQAEYDLNKAQRENLPAIKRSVHPAELGLAVA